MTLSHPERLPFIIARCARTDRHIRLAKEARVKVLTNNRKRCAAQGIALVRRGILPSDVLRHLSSHFLRANALAAKLACRAECLSNIHEIYIIALIKDGVFYGDTAYAAP